MEQIQSVLATVGTYALTGAVIAAVTQYLKQFIEKKGHKFLICLGLSIVGGALVYAIGFIPQNIVEVILGVWAAANSVYLAIKNVSWLQPTPAA